MGGRVTQARDRLRELPSVDRLLHHTKSAPLLARFNREYVTGQCRRVLEELRDAIRRGTHVDDRDVQEDAILMAVQRRVETSRRPGIQAVVNATGTVLHTNLGRALPASAAVDALQAAAGRHVSLEYDVERGGRGKREASIEQL